MFSHTGPEVPEAGSSLAICCCSLQVSQLLHSVHRYAQSIDQLKCVSKISGVAQERVRYRAVLQGDGLASRRPQFRLQNMQPDVQVMVEDEHTFTSLFA